MSWTPPASDPARELRDRLPAAQWQIPMAIICERHGVETATLSAFTTGSDIVWGAGDSVIKLTEPRWRTEIEAEARNLEFVRGKLTVRTPEVRAVGELGGWPYVLMGLVPGEAIGTVWQNLGASERLRLAGDMGRLTRELHDLDAEALPADWEPYWAACRTDVGRRHTEPNVPRQLTDAIDPFLARIGELDQSPPHVALHTELLDQHILVLPSEENDGRHELAALIDFADGRRGPRAYDFAAPVDFIFKGEAGLLRAFLLAYGYDESELTPALSRELLAWSLSHRFGRLGRMLAAVRPHEPRTLEDLAGLLFGLG